MKTDDHHRDCFWGVMLILLGVLFLLDNLNILDFGDLISRFWPVILILIGFRMLFRRRGSSVVIGKQEIARQGSVVSSMEVLSKNRFLGNIHLKVDSKNFKGGSASVFLGDINLDLSDITLAEGQQRLNLSGFIGDMNLVVPKNVPYAIQTSLSIGNLILFGQREEGFTIRRVYHSENYESAKTRLYIHVSFFIGDVKVF